VVISLTTLPIPSGMVIHPQNRRSQISHPLSPAVASAPEFALKYRTAISLFLRDMPRLSVDVDIDLAYLPEATSYPASVRRTYGTGFSCYLSFGGL